VRSAIASRRGRRSSATCPISRFRSGLSS
jgi:hypothetical protein